jgi:hypothetical protein
MACNPTRIELSNSAVTTLTVTLTTDPGDGVTVLLIVEDLSITVSGTTSGGSATLTPIAAVDADTNSLWDAIIQVGTNRPAVAEVLITKTNTAQGIGITVTDSEVTYCAPSAGGGGSGTVTSVGLNVPGGFTVAGTNPITTSGTFEITSALSGVIKADGAATFSGDATLDDLNGVVISLPTAKQVLYYNGTDWRNVSLTSGDIPSLDASKITSGTFDNARIAESNVTQYASSIDLNDLGDVNIATGAGNDGDLVYFNNSGGAGDKFKGVARSSIALSEFNDDLDYASSTHTHALGDLSDVDTAGATIGQVLEFDGADWVPASVAAIEDSYLMLIEAPSDKTYIIDGRVAKGRTVTNFYAKTSSGTCTATLKNVTNTTTIGTISVTSTGGSAASLSNTAVTENERLSIEISSNSSSADLELVVEYTQ